MFSKTAEPNSAPAPRAKGNGNAAHSILGSDLKVTGEISSTGALEVYGEIDGNITAQSLVIGAEGRVSGALTAISVEVKGHVDGKITSQNFTMRASSQVTADVAYSTAVIEAGAQIEGRFSKVDVA